MRTAERAINRTRQPATGRPRDAHRTLPDRVSAPQRPRDTRTSDVVADADRGLLERRYAIAAQSLAQGVCIFDDQQCVVLANDRYAEMYGLEPEQISAGLSLRAIIDLRISNGIYSGTGPEAYARERMRPVTRRTTRIVDLNDGRSILIVQQPTTDGFWVTTHEDITARLKAEEQVAFMALHDPLTGLSNRAALDAKLDEALRQMAPDEALAVLLIDLDRFKPVNDLHGHDVGDAVLKAVAERIRSSVRDTDLVARLGGDEFVIAHWPVQSADQSGRLAERLIAGLSAPISTTAGLISIGASIGIAATTPGALTMAALLKQADVALYDAKAAGRGGFAIFDPHKASQQNDDVRTPGSLK